MHLSLPFSVSNMYFGRGCWRSARQPHATPALSFFPPPSFHFFHISPVFLFHFMAFVGFFSTVAVIFHAFSFLVSLRLSFFSPLLMASKSFSSTFASSRPWVPSLATPSLSPWFYFITFSTLHIWHTFGIFLLLYSYSCYSPFVNFVRIQHSFVPNVFCFLAYILFHT